MRTARKEDASAGPGDCPAPVPPAGEGPLLLPADLFGYIGPFRFRGTEVFPRMLKTMRESFHHLKWTLWAVVIVFILGFVYFSGSSTNPNDRSTDTIARVGVDADHGRRVRPGIPAAARPLPRAVPRQPDPRDAPLPRPAAPGPGRHDQPPSRARGGPAAEARGLQRRGRPGRRVLPRLPAERPVHRAGEVRAAPLAVRLHARAVRGGAARGPARPASTRRSSARRSSCRSRSSRASSRRATTRRRSSTS